MLEIPVLMELPLSVPSTFIEHLCEQNCAVSRDIFIFNEQDGDLA